MVRLSKKKRKGRKASAVHLRSQDARGLVQ